MFPPTGTAVLLNTLWLQVCQHHANVNGMVSEERNRTPHLFANLLYPYFNCTHSVCLMAKRSCMLHPLPVDFVNNRCGLERLPDAVDGPIISK